MSMTSGPVCAQCGAANQPGTAVCLNCGMALVPAAVPPPVPPPPVPPPPAYAAPPAPPPAPVPPPPAYAAPAPAPVMYAAPAGSIAAPATSPGGPRLAPLALAIVGVLLAVGVVGWSLSEGSSNGGGRGEIFLEAAASPGTNPFTEPVDPTPSTTAAPTTSTPAVSAVPVALPTSGVTPPPGSPPFGGTGDNQTCDREKLITFLQANSDRGRAWAGVLGVAQADIPAYVRALTPTVLLYDTRVTNHGFANGRATNLQSILQAGTAVLVDGRGNPVVRCRCGNPLTPPAAISRPVVQGTPWPGYRPGVAVAVNNGVTVTVVINVTGASTSTVPAGVTTSSAPPTSATTSTLAGIPANTEEVDGLLAVLFECSGGDAQILDVRREPDLPDTYSVQARVKGVEMLFTYTRSTGTITEGDRASADLLQQCGVVR